jgi:hypothetical protein
LYISKEEKLDLFKISLTRVMLLKKLIESESYLTSALEERGLAKTVSIKKIIMVKINR